MAKLTPEDRKVISAAKRVANAAEARTEVQLYPNDYGLDNSIGTRYKVSLRVVEMVTEQQMNIVKRELEGDGIAIALGCAYLRSKELVAKVRVTGAIAELVMRRIVTK